MEPIIETRGLVHRYHAGRENQVVALEGINLEIYPGEFVVIVGQNGSGKSTLAKHFNALLQPSEGEVRVKGLDTRDHERTWEIRQAAGMVFQNPDNQIVATLVEEDVAFGPENLGLSPEEIRERVQEALGSVGMTAYRDREPHCLSGGQKQRVAIAGVLAMYPDVVILDEPTAMLDPAGRVEVLATLRRLNREKGMTIVLITHFMEEAVKADRVLVMKDGRVELDGTPHEVFARSDELRRLGLDLPPMAQLAHELREAGLKLPTSILSIEDMVAALCSS
mgnify:CR=1 FL=1